MSAPSHLEKIGIIILAAGESKRFDYFPKQLLELNGKTLIRSAVSNALNSAADLVCVVLGANAGQIGPEIEDLPVETVVNEDWGAGMASSLQRGLRRLLEIEPDLGGVGMILCDQPLIDPKIIDQLIASFRPGSPLIVASEYAETLGVPAIFSCQIFDELLNLKAGENAKKIILRDLTRITRIPVPQAAYDIDSKEDLQQFLEKFNPPV